MLPYNDFEGLNVFGNGHAARIRSYFGTASMMLWGAMVGMILVTL